MKFLRRQPPVFSPLSLAAVGRSTRLAFLASEDPRGRLREWLERRYRAERTIMCASGTAALRWGLHSVSAGRPVVALPAFTCFDVATAAVGADARIALYDLDPATLGPDLDSLERALRANTGTVVVAPLYGIPVDWDAVEGLATRFGAVVIEDAAQGYGASWRGQRLGTLGAVSVLSFGRGKGWTGAGGGALLLRRTGEMPGEVTELPEPHVTGEFGVLIRALAQHALGRPSVYGLPAGLPWLDLGETKYQEPRPPVGMHRASAALVCETQSSADREAEVRRANGDAFSAGIRFGGGVLPVRPPQGATPGFLRFPARLSRGLAGFRDVRQAQRLGIAPSYPSTLGALPSVRRRLVGGGTAWPGAKELVSQLVTFPTHSRLTPAERDQVLYLLNSYGTL